MRTPHLAAQFDLRNTGALNLGEVMWWKMTVLMLYISTVLTMLSTVGLR